METGSVESADLAGSVTSAPPLARRIDLTPDPDANRTLHEAVTLAGIADMGPLLPHLSDLPASAHARLKSAASDDSALP